MGAISSILVENQEEAGPDTEMYQTQAKSRVRHADGRSTHKTLSGRFVAKSTTLT